MAIRNIIGGPGVSDERVWSHKYIFRDGQFSTLPGGGWIDATKSRDCFVSGATAAQEVLQGGLFMGQLTGRTTWANSFLGVTTAATAKGATTVTTSTLAAVEILRRWGASTGTLFAVGPPVANGIAAVVPLTVSAVNTANGQLTVSATGGDEVHTLNIAGTISGGTFRLLFPNGRGAYIQTGTIAHNATFATVITNANTALDAVFGTGAIVASGTAYTGLVITFTAGIQNEWDIDGMTVADTTSLTGATNASTMATETTKGSYGQLIAGSLIGMQDGSFFPRSLIGPGYGIPVADGTNTAIGGVVPWAGIPIQGMPEFGQCAPVVTDLGIRRWLADQMSGMAPNTVGVSGSVSVGHKFIFPDFDGATY